MLFIEPDRTGAAADNKADGPSFFQRHNLRIPIMTKMLVAFLALTLSSLAVVGYITLNDIRDIGQYAFHSSVSLGEKAITDSTNALELLGRKIIEQRARDVAAQCEIYLQAHSSLTMEQLMEDSRFQEIAVQSVGNRGYTLLFEKKTGVILFHLNHRFVRFDTHRLVDQLPTAWKLFEATLDGSPKGGYYDWQDPDGVIREKYMYIVAVPGSPFMAAATTYIDEFLGPVEETKKKISEATASISNHINTRMQNTRNTFLDIIIMLIFFVSGISLILSRMITLPILTLTEGVQTLGRGDLDHKVRVRTSDELGELADSFNQMTRDLKNYMERLHCTTAEQERLLKELEIARRIQQNILPRETPDIEGMDVWGTNLPAREVGGDFFDYIPIDGTHWGLTIADVSGKGMAAAIFMGLSRTILRASASGNLKVTTAIRLANELICRDSTSGMFVTLFYGVLDTVGKKLTYINAGHYPALLFHGGSPEISHLEARGIPLGVTEDMELEERSVSLEPGDILVLYTDGVTEAMNGNEEDFGEERLRRLILKHKALSSREMVQKIQDEILLFSGEQPQFDDLTLVILKVNDFEKGP